MNEQERQEFNDLKAQVKELTDFITQNFNEDGTPRNPFPVVIEAEDSTTAAAGSIRVITNKGPKNILVA